VEFYRPVMYLFFLAQGFSFTEIAILEVVYNLITVLGEVPTGYLGGRMGRRNSLLVGTAVVALTLVGIGPSGSFLALLVLYGCWSMGYNFRSGSEDAWLYDTLTGDAEADFTSAPSAWTRTYDCSGARPWRTTASTPVVLSACGRVPPNVESKKPFVIGLTNPRTPREVDWNGVAFMRPTAIASTFAGSSGSASTGTCSATCFATNPLPPGNRRASRGACQSLARTSSWVVLLRAVAEAGGRTPVGPSDGTRDGLPTDRFRGGASE
jgi:hypothetical protein